MSDDATSTTAPAHVLRHLESAARSAFIDFRSLAASVGAAGGTAVSKSHEIVCECVSGVRIWKVVEPELGVSPGV